MRRRDLDTSDGDRLRRLAGIGARAAAAALEGISGREVWIRETSLRPSDDRSFGSPAVFEAGVAFRVEGDVEGVIAILFTPRARILAVDSLLGTTHVTRASIESAFVELGNILASHAVSAIADAAGARILLSIPTLETKEANVDLPTVIFGGAPHAAGARAETELLDRDGELRALIVLAPGVRASLRRPPSSL